MNYCKCKEVIITNLETRGSGEGPISPVRLVTQVYSKKGKLIAESDNMGSFSIEQLYDFASYCIKHKSKNVLESFQKWKKY